MAGRRDPPPDEAVWTGGYRPYDLVKEFVIVLVVVGLLSVALAGGVLVTRQEGGDNGSVVTE